MEFLNDYKDKMDHFRERYSYAKAEISDLQGEIATLNEEYRKAVESLEFERANDFKVSMKHLEAELETKQDIAGIIKAKSLSCSKEDAADMFKKYNKYKSKKIKEGGKIRENIEKKKAEYILAVREARNYNQEILAAVQAMHNVPYEWSGEESNAIIELSQFHSVDINDLRISPADLNK